MAEIKNGEQFEVWLTNKPLEWARALAVRVALRVFPIVASSVQRKDLTLVVGRALLISWAASKWPAQDMMAAAAAAYAAAVAPAYATATTRTVAAIAAAYATATAAAAAAAAYAAAYAAAAAAVAYTAAAWSAVEKDANWLEGEEQPIPAEVAARLIHEPLWLSDIPREIVDAWEHTEQNLSALNEDWQVWLDWYRRRLKGYRSAFGISPSSADEAFVVALTWESDIFWEREPAIVNAEIAARLATALAPSGAQDATDGEQQPPEVPPTRPATINPDWYNGVLDLNHQPALPDPGTKVPDALRALADNLRGLIADISDENGGNIDKRVVKSLNRFIEHIPETDPTEYEIHRLGLMEASLNAYGAKVVAVEWPDMLAVDYSATLSQFDDVMRQFPSWRQFKRNVAHEELDGLTPKDVGESLSALGEVLTNAEVVHAGPALASVMAEQAETLSNTNSDEPDLDKQETAKDAIEGERNILKKMLDRFAKGMREEALQESEKLGRDIIRAGFALVRTLAPKILATVATGTVAYLTVTDPALHIMMKAILQNPEVLNLVSSGSPWLVGGLTFVISFLKRNAPKPE